jgi:hypothetical protein
MLKFSSMQMKNCLATEKSCDSKKNGFSNKACTGGRVSMNNGWSGESAMP